MPAAAVRKTGIEIPGETMLTGPGLELILNEGSQSIITGPGAPPPPTLSAYLVMTARCVANQT